MFPITTSVAVPEAEADVPTAPGGTVPSPSTLAKADNSPIYSVLLADIFGALGSDPSSDGWRADPCRALMSNLLPLRKGVRRRSLEGFIVVLRWRLAKESNFRDAPIGTSQLCRWRQSMGCERFTGQEINRPSSNGHGRGSLSLGRSG